MTGKILISEELVNELISALADRMFISAGDDDEVNDDEVIELKAKLEALRDGKEYIPPVPEPRFLNVSRAWGKTTT